MEINIADNYYRVIERISKAAKKCHRNPEDIRLVVVTKTMPIQVVEEVIDAGATELGENYIEEAVAKITVIKKESIKWHMIGHVQSRKASLVCEYFHCLHSLDSLKLAERLSRFTVALHKDFPVMLEFNVGDEASKSGWPISKDENWGQLIPEIESIAQLPGIKLIGVMTIPPFSENPEDSRPYYIRLRKFKEFITNNIHLPLFSELSMGMSNDFEVAIQEGSTCVRIGQAILGPRSK